MRQITIVTASHDGLVADITKVLCDASVNIESLEEFGTQECGITQLGVDRYDKSLLAVVMDKRAEGIRLIADLLVSHHA